MTFLTNLVLLLDNIVSNLDFIFKSIPSAFWLSYNVYVLHHKNKMSNDLFLPV